MDWSLRACSRKGHVTYAPDEAPLRQRMHVKTPAGEAWRCLRCWDFVVGEPTGTGPATAAPIVLRGRVLRDAFVLRILAVERLIRALVIGALAYAVVRFESSETSLRHLFEKAIPRAKPLADLFNYDLDKSPTVQHLRHLLNSKPHTLHLVLAFLIVYGVVEVAEAVGLWSLKRWGEYVAVVGTSLFLPLEIYELTDKVSYLKIVALVINLALVVYLLFTKRLFGLRGGRRKYEEERASDSLIEVEAAAAAGAGAPSQSSLSGARPS
ncbi:MAG: DUF2127 domain-containing protein [Actinomycetes bacterium]